MWPKNKHRNKIFNATNVMSSKTILYVPHLLDIFYMVVTSGKLNNGDSDVSERTIRLKNSVAQDIVYAASNKTIKTPTSVLFPTFVNLLCNNTEVIKIINQYDGHCFGCDKVEEIETEYTLKVIDEQKQSRVIIPEGVTANNCDSSVALMVGNNIDNLENAMTGSGTGRIV